MFRDRGGANLAQLLLRQKLICFHFIVIRTKQEIDIDYHYTRKFIDEMLCAYCSFFSSTLSLPLPLVSLTFNSAALLTIVALFLADKL